MGEFDIHFMVRSFLVMVVLSLFPLMPINAQEEDFAALMLAQSKYDFEETYSRLKDRLGKDEVIQIFAEIDHAENARKAGMKLLPAKLIIFGNAKAGTPIMQNRQVAGLDLPLKILLFENEKGDVLLAYSDVALLKKRYALKTKKILRGIGKNLRDITKDVAGRNPKRTSAYKVRYQEGILSIKSKHSFSESLSKLKSEINKLDKLVLFAEIDHTKNAEEKGLGMRPASLLILGNAEVGTRLMQHSGVIGLELPVKILVWRDEKGVVQLSYNSADFLSKRFKLTSDSEELIKIEKLLTKLAKKAVGVTSD